MSFKHHISAILTTDHRIVAVFVLCLFMQLSGLNAIGHSDNSGTIPFIEKDGLILIEGVIDQKKGLFILDTGADYLFLDENDAGANDYEDFSTAQGSVQLGRKQVRMFQLGNRVWKDLEGYLVDLRNVEDRIGEDIAGIVGISFVLPSALEIDHVKKQIAVNAGPEDVRVRVGDEQVIEIPMEYTEDALPIIAIDIDGKSYRMGLDSGAGVNIIFGPKARELRKKSDQLGDRQKVIVPGSTTRRLKSFYPPLTRINNIGVRKATFLLGAQNKVPMNVDGLINLRLLGFEKYIIDTEQKKLLLFVSPEST